MKFHWPRIFRRRRTTSTGAGDSPKVKVLRSSHSSPDLPLSKPDNNFPAGVAQPVASMTLPGNERTEMPVPHPAEAPGAPAQVQMPVPQINVLDIPSAPANVVFPATPGTPGTLGIPDELDMWHGVQGARSKGKVEKGMDQMDKDAQVVKNRLSDAHNAVSFVKDLASNELVQDIGKKVLAGIPQLMNGLEELSKVHPFIRGNDEDPDMYTVLPDDWMTAYLLPKRLRYLQRAMDLDTSGSITVSEVNAFSDARPADWR
ncbi:hypothetical protein HMN09_00935500 [Mycena chlorophos]|uniref:EF-hand domain-containing protein n=1 Tax=Mycena chlorophos TaxID=658473 RepID=A0A8H6SKJ7_MYCCL|nr:hypothetical protein HMN09_00935500 [Mycena chlorophos]